MSGNHRQMQAELRWTWVLCVSNHVANQDSRGLSPLARMIVTLAYLTCMRTSRFNALGKVSFNTHISWHGLWAEPHCRK